MPQGRGLATCLVWRRTPRARTPAAGLATREAWIRLPRCSSLLAEMLDDAMGLDRLRLALAGHAHRDGDGLFLRPARVHELADIVGDGLLAAALHERHRVTSLSSCWRAPALRG